jgi:hypothetical protein
MVDETDLYRSIPVFHPKTPKLVLAALLKK